MYSIAAGVFYTIGAINKSNYFGNKID